MNPRTHFLIFILLLSFVPAHHAQTNKDSLWNVWNDENAADTNRLKAIQALTWPMLNVNLDSAYLLAQKQLAFATAANQQKWIARALYNIATHFYLKSDYIQSVTYYQQSLEIRKQTGDKKGEAAIYGNLGLIYGAQGNLLRDLEYQRKSLAINEQLNDTANLTSNYNNIATIYQKQRDSTKALEYYRKSLRMYEAQDAEAHIALVYNNMGNLYREFRDFEKAEQYLLRSLEVRTRKGDHLGMAITYVNLGTLYNKKGDFVKARQHTLLSIEHFKTLRDTSSLANGYFTLGESYMREGKYSEAVKWCTLSKEIAYASNKIPVEQAACFCLYDAYKKLGQPGKSLENLEAYVALDDSLSEEELKVALGRLEFEKEILADSLLREEEKSQIEAAHQQELRKKNRTTYIIVFIGIGILMLSLLFLSRMLIFQRNSEVLKRKTQELEKQQLVSEISLLRNQVNPHFLFNSLSILSSLVKVDPDLSEKFIDQLSRSYRYILEQKDLSLVTLRTELGFIESYAFLLKIRFENKFNIQVDLPEEVLDRYKIAPLTLQLLVENAVKHNRMSVAEPLVVTISLEGEKNLIVKNKLQPRSTPTTSTGVGLQNIMNRYALLTDCRVWAGETEDQFVVRIPLLNETAKNQS